ncbi:MAG: four helix bundle protein [Calditrichaeota bacterium]|nr:four helix bundle protein [Calditrichota bacterium]
MATFRSFEEIEAWKKARELTYEIYTVTSAGHFAKDLALRDQIRRASVSIMSNISEGYERGGNKEFIQFLSVAKGSAGEVRSQLYVANDQGYLTKSEFDRLSGLAAEVSQIINGLMSYLKQSDLKGTKFQT